MIKKLYSKLMGLNQGYTGFKIPKMTLFEALFVLNPNEETFQGEPLWKWREDEIRIKMLAKNALRR